VQSEWRRQMEAAPTHFMATVLPSALRRSAAAIGAAIGASAGDIALVDNATAAANAILGSIAFLPGDEIVVHSHIYGAVLKTARHIAARTGAVLVTAELPFPDPTEEGIVAAFAAALTPRTRLAIVDHITSPSALVLPLVALVDLCRAAKVPVLVDGAHGPGQVPLDLAALGADYYVGNGHKWWMGPKGAGFLWAAPARQADLPPTIISHGYGSGFLAEFDWTGTRDWSAALALPDAIAFHARLGGTALMAANAALAASAASDLARRFRTRLAAPPSMHAAMTLVALPFSGPATEQRALALRAEFLALGCDVPVTALGGTLWLRLSAQAYNLPSDFERLGDLVDMIGQRQA